MNLSTGAGESGKMVFYKVKSVCLHVDRLGKRLGWMELSFAMVQDIFDTLYTRSEKYRVQLATVPASRSNKKGLWRNKLCA